MKNIAEILKNCPKGTKLYSSIFGEVELDEVTDSIFVRHALNKTLIAFYTDGKYHSNGECILFPSKENRDWNKFKAFKYPTTFEDCVEILQLEFNPIWSGVPHRQIDYKDALLYNLKKLLICRDAYWKIAGDWDPDWGNAAQTKYCITVSENNIRLNYTQVKNRILAFPTEEMRDTFYENFKELIVSCKELL